MKIGRAVLVSRTMRCLYAVVVVAAAAGLAVAGKAGAKPGEVTGVVTFSGKAPAAEPVKAPPDPACAKARAQHQAIRVSDGKLAEAVVVLEGKGLSGKPPADPVVIDQDGCMYQPRVAAAVDGQSIEVRNSDPTLHNVHGYAGGSTAFNLAQPPKGKPLRREVADPGVLELKCDVHPWMHAWVYVAEHPYITVTDKAGAFSLEGVPPGRYTLRAWHPVAGETTTRVTVKAGHKATTTLTID